MLEGGFALQHGVHGVMDALLLLGRNHAVMCAHTEEVVLCQIARHVCEFRILQGGG